MLEYAVLEGNPFMENTYLVYDETRSCVIIDPGCYDSAERKRLIDYIKVKCLKPVALINTHCHIDHVLGNSYVSKRFGLEPVYHKKEEIVMASCVEVAARYHIPYTPSPLASKYLLEGESISFGNSKLDIVFTPGHSPGSISLINHEHGLIFAGDVLFQGSIGRTDLPGGDFSVLEHSIRTQLYSLPDHFKVLPGHGGETTIGAEKQSNPFVKALS